jgi:outer membrane receptor protein involved in Fe transport
MANPEYLTETSWTYEIGAVKTILKDTKLLASFYYMDISNYQQHNYTVSSKQPELAVYNIDMLVYGIELGVTRRFRQDLSGYLTYTYQDWSAEDHPMDGEYTSYLLQNQPRNKVVLGVDYKLWENGGVTLNSKYIGERYSQNDITMQDVIIVDVGAHHTFNLPHNCKLTVKGYVNNVTDQEYQLRYGYDMPGTTAGIGMTLKY